MIKVERHIIMRFVLRDRLLMSLKLEEVIKLKYHNEQNKVFFIQMLLV
jgi:hypothetical protein